MKVLEVGGGELSVVRLPDNSGGHATACGLLAEALSFGRGEACSDANNDGASSAPTLASLTRVEGEVSVVLPTSLVQGRDLGGAENAKVEGEWRAMKIDGTLDFSLVGVLKLLLEPLAAAQVAVFALSTYDTDYILVKESKLEAAFEALSSAGHQVERISPTPSDQLVLPGQDGRIASTGLTEFGLERYFAKYEFSAEFLLCCSDCHSLTMSQVVEMADEECLKLWNDMHLGYTTSQGLPQLRDEIAKSFAPQECDSDDVLEIVPVEGIYLVARALLRPGDHVIVPSPCYQALSEVAKAIGCTVTWWEPEQDENHKWTFKTEKLAALMTTTTRLVVVNFPHNPTSFLPSAAQWTEIVDCCRSVGAYLFCDEMYRGLEFETSSRLAPAFAAYEKGITLGGVSKSLSSPGLRVGWLVTKDPHARKALFDLKDYTTICGAGPSEVLALIVLRNADKVISSNVETSKANLKTVLDFCGAHPEWFQSAEIIAGSTCYAKFCPGNSLKFCDMLAKEASVMLLPSEAYGMSGGFMRFGLGKRNIDAGLQRLASFLEKHEPTEFQVDA